MPERSNYQKNIIRNYYENRENIALQRAQEILTELYLSDGKKRQRYWKNLETHLLKLGTKQETIDHLIEQDDPQIAAQIIETACQIRLSKMHLNQQQADVVKSNLKTLQIICFSLISGILIALILLCVVIDWKKLTTALEMLPMIGIGIGFLCIVQAFVIPGIVASTSANSIESDSDDDRLKKIDQYISNQDDHWLRPA